MRHADVSSETAKYHRVPPANRITRGWRLCDAIIPFRTMDSLLEARLIRWAPAGCGAVRDLTLLGVSRPASIGPEVYDDEVSSPKLDPKIQPLDPTVQSAAIAEAKPSGSHPFSLKELRSARSFNTRTYVKNTRSSSPQSIR